MNGFRRKVKRGSLFAPTVPTIVRTSRDVHGFLLSV